MKILLFEYITGGGMSKGTLPEALVKEGGMMLKALINDLLLIDEVHLVVPLDWRLSENEILAASDRIDVVEITRGEDVMKHLPGMFAHCDAIWPIAPETDNILADICKLAEQSGKLLLTSSAEATACAGNKYQTYICLSRYNIATVDTVRIIEQSAYVQGSWVLKPVDGVGCEGIIKINNSKEFQQTLEAIGNQSQYLMQPYIMGKTISLCCLFKQGKAWLICCNEQKMTCIDRKFVLNACLVNIQTQNKNYYQNLIDKVALAMPGLWGYAGIDIIETEQQAVVLEINPRLTTSYAGLSNALGINVAKQVLCLLDKQPRLNPTMNKQIAIPITGEAVGAT